MASHATAIAGILALPVDWPARLAGLGAVTAHAAWRRPRRVGRLVAAADGRWSLPDYDATDLRLSPATRLGASWIELRLEGPRSRHRVLLCCDQLSRAAWRRLKLRVRLGLATTQLS